MRYVVTDASGNILRSGYASNPALQAGTGETAYVITGTDGAVIPDADVKITAGAFEAVGAYAGDLPSGELAEAAPE